MTLSQRSRRVGSSVWRVLGRSAHSLRNLHDEQMYALECLFRPVGAPWPRGQAPTPAGDSHTTAGSRTPAPAGAAGSGLAA